MKSMVLDDLLISARSGYWGKGPDESDTNVRVIRNGDVKPGSGVRWDQTPTRSFRRSEVEKSSIRQHDILLTTSGDCGVVAYVEKTPDEVTCASNFIRVLRFDTAVVDPQYAFQYLRTTQFRAALRPYIRGTTLQNLSTRQAFPVVSLPVPALHEQRRVAAIMEQADALRTKRHQVLTRYDDLAQSIFHSMFGDPLRNPFGWHTATVGDVCTRVTDGEHQTPRRSKEGVPLLSARSIQRGWIDFSATDFIDDDEYDLLRRRIEPQKDDVLISCSGTIGRVARVGEMCKFAMVRSAALVRPGGSIAASFLEQLLGSTSMNRLMNARANSSAQANLFQNQIKSLPVVVPPLELQREFEGRLDQVRLRRASLAEAGHVTGELHAALQSRAFRGEL